MTKYNCFFIFIDWTCTSNNWINSTFAFSLHTNSIVTLKWGVWPFDISLDTSTQSNTHHNTGTHFPNISVQAQACTQRIFTNCHFRKLQVLMTTLVVHVIHWFFTSKGNPKMPSCPVPYEKTYSSCPCILLT